MKIKWFGHACFLITSDSGARIVTDPFDNSVGYELPDVEADIVTVSHNHFDHNNAGLVKGNPMKLEKPGRFVEKRIDIIGVSTFHDELSGSKRGMNVIFKFDVDGIMVCHCGDLGHVLTMEQAAEIGHVDVLLVPVGGTFTVDAAKAFEVVRQLKPEVTIPMHYKTGVLDFPIEGVDRFLNLAGGGERIGSQEIELVKSKLSGYPDIIVLAYK